MNNESYKNLIGKSSTNSNLSFYEETKQVENKVSISNIWVDSKYIPSSISSSMLTNDIYSIKINDIQYDILSYIVNCQLIKVAGTLATFSSVGNQLVDCIPYDFGQGYQFILKDSNNKIVPFGLNQWIVDGRTGQLSFNKGIPDGYSAPFYISFYRYVGRKGDETLLTSDGNVKLDSAYTPSDDASIANKKYVDGLFGSLSSLIKVYTPTKPATLKGQNITISSPRMFSGKFILSSQEYSVAIEGDNLVLTSDYFYNEETGYITIGIGEQSIFDNKNIRKLIVSKDISEGQYDTYWKVISNSDPYKDDPVARGFYKVLKVQCTIPISELMPYYSSNSPFLSFKFIYHSSNGTTYETNYKTIGFEPEPTSSRITGVNLYPDDSQSYLSGVPTLSSGTILSLSGSVVNMNRFYIDKFMHITIQGLLDKDILVTDKFFGNSNVYSHTDGLETKIGQSIAIPSNMYQETTKVHIDTYNIFGEINGSYDETFNVRIDTISETERIVAGAGETPENGTYGAAFDDTVSLRDNTSELQQKAGYIIYPSGNYSLNGTRTKIYTTETGTTTTQIQNISTGPNYDYISDVTNRSMRYIMLHTLLEDATNAVVIDLDDSSGLLCDEFTKVFTNCEMRCRINSTDDFGWINANKPYDGVSDPSADNDGALVVQNSSRAKRYITFGKVPRKGWLYIRIGFSDVSIKISNISVTPIV